MTDSNEAFRRERRARIVSIQRLLNFYERQVAAAFKDGSDDLVEELFHALNDDEDIVQYCKPDCSADRLLREMAMPTVLREQLRRLEVQELNDDAG